MSPPFGWPPLARCIICGAPARDDGGRLFCAPHRAQYEVRQRDGVDTLDLDARWGDTLAAWRQRPAALHPEPLADRLRFRRRWGEYLLFAALVGGRRPDWLAVHLPSGGVRRYVEVADEDVVQDLAGRRAAAGRFDVAARWGAAEPQGPGHRFEQAVRSGRLRLAAAVAGASFPVYGVASDPPRHGLKLRSAQLAGGSRGVAHVGLTFEGRAPGGAPIRLVVTSSDPLRNEVGRYWAELAALPAGLRSALVAAVYSNWWPIGDPEELTLELGPDVVTGHTTALGDSPDRFGYVLQGAAVLLHGESAGLSRPEFREVLASLLPVGDRAATLARYQAELSEP